MRTAARVGPRLSRVATALALALGATLAATPAAAVSCTEQGAACAAWATGQYAGYKGKCAKEIAACKVRCKAGRKVFIGVLVGNSYPIDSCN